MWGHMWGSGQVGGAAEPGLCQSLALPLPGLCIPRPDSGLSERQALVTAGNVRDVPQGDRIPEAGAPRELPRGRLWGALIGPLEAGLGYR